MSFLFKCVFKNDLNVNTDLATSLEMLRNNIDQQVRAQVHRGQAGEERMEHAASPAITRSRARRRLQGQDQADPYPQLARAWRVASPPAEDEELPLPAAESFHQGPSTQSPPESKRCVVCMVARRDTIIIPCGHYKACYKCTEQSHRATKACYLCRQPVQQYLRVYED
jgi:hypothetical protein